MMSYDPNYFGDMSDLADYGPPPAWVRIGGFLIATRRFSFCLAIVLGLFGTLMWLVG